MYSEKCFRCYNGITFEAVKRRVVCTKISAIMSYLEYIGGKNKNGEEIDMFLCDFFVKREGE